MGIGFAPPTWLRTLRDGWYGTDRDGVPTAEWECIVDAILADLPRQQAQYEIEVANYAAACAAYQYNGGQGPPETPDAA